MNFSLHLEQVDLVESGILWAERERERRSCCVLMPKLFRWCRIGFGESQKL